ncbi:hypothetical protein WJX74_009964 [Apatococcus lobatus]|uniref:Nuclear pore complex protein NUP35 n=1 Tax=Apatococcus lobatus TaxID=904363 RepID=A0AAW1RIP6_9CHLO
MSLMAPPSATKEYPSLLFTPRSGDLKGQPDFRTPRAARSPSSGYGKSGMREGSTPRRRSLSPSGSAQRDAAPPPPPPSESLLDSPASHSLSPWARTAPAGDKGGEAGPSSQPAAAGPPPSATLQESFAQPRQQPQAQVPSDEWVTVFGFQPAQLQTVMREFSRCGDIQNFGSFREDHVNWVHVQYANKWQTARALQKNGARLEGGLMVGVRPLDGLDRAAVESGVDQSAAAVPAAVAAWRAAPAPLASRPYLLTQPPTAIALTQNWLPQPSRTAWDKISEFVFGS